MVFLRVVQFRLQKTPGLWHALSSDQSGALVHPRLQEQVFAGTQSTKRSHAMDTPHTRLYIPWHHPNTRCPTCCQTHLAHYMAPHLPERPTGATITPPPHRQSTDAGPEAAPVGTPPPPCFQRHQRLRRVSPPRADAKIATLQGQRGGGG